MKYSPDGQECYLTCLCLQAGDEESREQLIKTHYMARVGELTTQLQISDSKAVHFHSEVKLSSKRFTNCFSQQRTDLFPNTKIFVVYDVRNEDLSVQNSHLLCPLVLSFLVISYLFVSFFYLKKVTQNLTLFLFVL